MSPRFHAQHGAVQHRLEGGSMGSLRDIESRLVPLFTFLVIGTIILGLGRTAQEVFGLTTRVVNIMLASVMASLILFHILQPWRPWRSDSRNCMPVTLALGAADRITQIGRGFDEIEVNELGLERFEPFVVRCMGLVFAGSRSFLCACVFGVCGGGVAFFLCRYFGVISSVGGVIYSTGVAMFMGWLGVSVCFPLYLRIVPGRLEIMQYWIFGGKPQIVVSLDMARARMCFDFASKRVRIETPSLRLVIPFGLIRERERLCARLVGSALAPVPAPILEFDELIT